ncbi:MAG: gas vesicle protein K [Armatimonadetes bacterium]|nr:gas vesicle protein K [Armatimonadota bacterium]
MQAIDLHGPAVAKVLTHTGETGTFASEVAQAPSPLARRINADPRNVEQGLAKLVLTIVELLRQLMERQALRRMEAGSLTDDEVERLGDTLWKLDERMTELCGIFGLRRQELGLDLGPLGDLL